MRHISVLLNETIDGLNIKDGDLIIDGTLGDGGHTEEILKRFPNVRVIAFDRDPDAIKRAKVNLSKFLSRVKIINSNFSELDNHLEKDEVPDGIIFDFGLSTYQLLESGRGFSFKGEEPLLMTMGDDSLDTAFNVVNTFPEKELERIIREYGEEKYSWRIAKRIVETRKIDTIKTSGELARIIADAVPKMFGRKIDPATKTFQGIRIFINDELRSIENGLKAGLSVLNSGGRICAISFHSLEDRIVKNVFRDEAKGGSFKIITKRPIISDEKELQENPRARSAKLRIIEKND
ncbi:MAG: 16S rRNA (cytosine(1402)-N(4))-methyltransferase RsmH [Candidatus Pacebacteria bacterium]|jgi:16S rRNA (cytosine1402-N4)-methyltransferase|nr:16S rRNA (cytosine(1402)-N(4))-methyltransferase RsmH [Candidatus Paceibacterota bacterium]MBP9058648.1 16S rRNA (cytosine(1402)-N(4))-methyltransferase RsmH [Candidatus Paceibacterota bacterium]MBP9770399.1 16S rRNA (cytosine(1402)-N(4))-methyltransferase RsmH [Candidatus Paceibacterota bacterium]